MNELLLVTLWNERSIKNFSFDRGSQSIQYVGFDDVTDSGNALACVELVDGCVVAKPEGDSLLYSPTAVDVPVCSVKLDGNTPTVLGVRPQGSGGLASVFVRPAMTGIGRYRRLRFRHDGEFLIGRGHECAFCYRSTFVSARHARLTYSEGLLSIEDLGSGNGTFVNGVKLSSHQPRWLKPGETVQILDFVIMAARGFVLANRPDDLDMRAGALVEGSEMREDSVAWETPKTPLTHERVSLATGSPVPAFYPAPRLARSVHAFALRVDAPPQRSTPQDTPALLQMGPSFLMGLTSVFMAINCMSTLLGGGQVLQTLPTLAMSFGMLGGSVVWPLISRLYNRRKDAIRENRRCQSYMAYLDSVESRLQAEADAQAIMLQDNRLSVQTLLSRATEMSALLMNRTSEHEDFMDLRVGVGDCELEADVTWPTGGFTITEDPMLGKAERLALNPPSLHDVPLSFNPMRNRITGILGERRIVWEFLRGLLVQVCALYSYHEVKIVLVSDVGEREEWAFLASLAHACHGDDGKRLVALTDTGVLAIDMLLEHELDASKTDERCEVGPTTCYLVVCANAKLAKRSSVVALIRGGHARDTAMLVYVGSELSELPRECNYIIDLSPDGGRRLGMEHIPAVLETCDARERAWMFDRTDVFGTLRAFTPDIMVTQETADDFARHMARVRLEGSSRHGSMPESLGFLEMYEVGNASHLNVLQRWADGDASRSLQTMVGVDDRGERALLDLHEDVHGPHGLIAGTTGSGKSEFIITYVLSLCASYAPDEVAFVIIDYKGGGLAGAFHNEQHHLPHLAGTITNLDGSSIGRSLVSIKSELKRRQRAFNDAREATGEATMDIYKYLACYRQGILSEPMPHLIIIADEFAELKQQEPEFMDELVSAARIGRSLGVHLVLATQKPSGVVDDQIWSNARLKISLKVADASDSREMIHRDDAARLTHPGEFMLLVGYDESFWRGQTAYAGMPYAPKDRFEPRRDDAVELLDAEGETVARLKPRRTSQKQTRSELNAVLEQIEQASRASGKQARRLWLDPLPEQVSLLDLRHRYGSWEDGVLTCVVGEADDPGNQRRFLYRLDLAQVGNVMLYGSQSSGVERLLVAMALSMAMEHGGDELWLYGLDFGEGRLRLLKRLESTGDVVSAGDGEGLDTFFRLLETEISRRRSRASALYEREDDRGEANDYGAPRVVVCVANLASLFDLHAEFEDRLASVTRDAPRYGIHFLVTASSANAVRMRLRANFGVHIPTMLNDAGDYLSILGSLGGIVPPHQERRGLAKIGKSLYEFQGVSIGDVDEDVDGLLDMAAGGACGVAGIRPPSIPRLPQRVLAEHMADAAGAKRLPVGYAKVGVVPLCIDLRKSPCVRVLGNDADSLTCYVRGVYETLSRWPDATYTFVDPWGMLGQTNDSRVLDSMNAVTAFVQGISRISVDEGILVFMSAVQMLESLDAETSARLKDYIIRVANSGVGLLVMVTEYWRTKTLYEDWYRAVSVHGSGVWVGGGFADQTAYSYARQLPEYRQQMAESDGFAVMGGEVTPVRLVGACT